MTPGTSGRGRGLDGVLKSTDGYPFRRGRERWQLNRETCIVLTYVKSKTCCDIYDAYTRVLGFFATNNPPYTVLRIDTAFRRFVDSAGSEKYNCDSLKDFRASGGSDYNLQVLKSLFRKWVELGHYGITYDMVAMLEAWKLDSSIVGDAIKRLDPNEGPFGDIEFQNLIESAAYQYESGGIDISQFTILLLLQSTGRRTLQIMNLRIKDLIKLSTTGGGYRYFVNIPRIKQRCKGFRKEFRKAEVIQDIWIALMRLREDVISRFERQLRCEIPADLAGELPLYFSERKLKAVRSLALIETKKDLDWLHILKKDFYFRLDLAIEKCGVRSQFADAALKVVPRRYRYTFGTRLAREGVGEQIIAELLDHTTTSSAYIYTLNVPEHGAYIDRMVGGELIPIANSFVGVVVEGKEKARRGSAQGSDIRSSSGKPSGTCGHVGVCGANVPAPCYTCPYFQPWMNAPHEEYYQELLGQRIELLRLTADPAIASIMDRTILAVAEVVKACNDKKQE